MRGQTFKFKSQKQKLAPTRVGSIYCSPGNLDKTQLKTTRPMASLENREMKSNRENMVVFVRNTMAGSQEHKAGLSGRRTVWERREWRECAGQRKRERK